MEQVRENARGPAWRWYAAVVVVLVVLGALDVVGALDVLHPN